jgi:hypothetical protein
MGYEKTGHALGTGCQGVHIELARLSSNLALARYTRPSFVILMNCQKKSRWASGFFPPNRSCAAMTGGFV